MILGATKSVPFREVSSIQGCPYRGVPLYYAGADAIVSVICMGTCIVLRKVG